MSCLRYNELQLVRCSGAAQKHSAVQCNEPMRQCVEGRAESSRVVVLWAKFVQLARVAFVDPSTSPTAPPTSPPAISRVSQHLPEMRVQRFLRIFV